MLYWQPNWQDVRWDPRAAEAFIATLLATAAELESIIQDHRSAGATYFLSWQGEKSTMLQATLETSYQRLLGLATSYRDLAQRVRTQNDRAIDEQARRDQERRRWHAELAAEQQRAQTAR
jgi:uncharacterized protein YukE